MTGLQTALELASFGFRPTFLKHKGKKPLLLQWQHIASADPEEIKKQHSEAVAIGGEDLNVGVVTGEGLLVLDIDCKNNVDGMATLRALRPSDTTPVPTVAVQTPSGGRHLYYRLPQGVSIGSSVGREGSGLGPGLDIRADNGQVVAPGSRTDKGAYSWLPGHGPTEIEIAPAPEWLLKKLATGAPRKERAAIDPNLELDSPSSINSAVDYLKNAKPSLQGEGGNHNAFAVAARVRDLAVSESEALELMLDHWNDRCEPTWGVEELQTIVANAYRYARNAPAVPGSEFEAVEITDITPPLTKRSLPTGPFRATLLEPFDPETLPKRQWVIEGRAARGNVSLLTAPPGVGKTMLFAQTALALTFNRGDMIGATIKEPCNVWTFNAEDDRDELKRRFGAATKCFGLKREDGAFKLFADSGADRPLSLGRYDAAGRFTENRIDVEAIIAEIKAKDIGVFMADPLSDLHEVDENKADGLGRVIATLRAVAQLANCAVLVAVHTTKLPGKKKAEFAGNMDAMRGTSKLAGTARFVHTLVKADPANAKVLGVPVSEIWRYSRLDTAKSNLSAAGGGSLWFRMESVDVGNPADPESIGVMVPFQPLSRVKAELDLFAPTPELVEMINHLVALPEAANGAKVPLAPARDAVAKSLNKSHGSNGAVARYIRDVVGYGKPTRVGEYEIEFFEPVSVGGAAKVAIRQATNANGSAS